MTKVNDLYLELQKYVYGTNWPSVVSLVNQIRDVGKADERQKVLAEIEGWLVDDVYSRQAQAVIDRRNSDPMCTTPYPREARWKDERNRFRAELRAKLVEMKVGK